MSTKNDSRYRTLALNAVLASALAAAGFVETAPTRRPRLASRRC
jgi:hypothetical protein